MENVQDDLEKGIDQSKNHLDYVQVIRDGKETQSRRWKKNTNKEVVDRNVFGGDSKYSAALKDEVARAFVYHGDLYNDAGERLNFSPIVKQEALKLKTKQHLWVSDKVAKEHFKKNVLPKIQEKNPIFDEVNKKEEETWNKITDYKLQKNILEREANEINPKSTYRDVLWFATSVQARLEIDPLLIVKRNGKETEIYLKTFKESIERNIKSEYDKNKTLNIDSLKIKELEDFTKEDLHIPEYKPNYKRIYEKVSKIIEKKNKKTNKNPFE